MPESKKLTYELSTLGLPPLKMVLVHARNDAKNTPIRSKPDAGGTSPEAEAETLADKEKAVRKLIQHLETSD